MNTWILIATIGGIFSIIGLLILIQRYIRGEITKFSLFAVIIGYISFISFVLISAFYPESVSGPIGVMILLPALVAVVLLVHQIQKSKKISE